MDRPRGTTRALVLTPTRELAAQILADLNDLAVHTPLSGAAVFGGVGMGPQEHAFRSGVDVIVATPGRLLDHFRMPYAKLAGLEFLVLDEADRMLDMGFLPDIRRVLRHLPTPKQTLFFSATMPAPIGTLAHEMLKNPVTLNLARKATPAVGITQAIYPGRAGSQDVAARRAAQARRDEGSARLHAHEASRQPARRAARSSRRSTSARIHGNRSQAQRTEALDGFKSGRYRVLVATDIAARGIDVEELGHVVNFDVPLVPEDYIHRVGRTARAEATGDAFTFVAPDEEADLRAIEQAIGKRLPRVTVPDFDYTARAAERFEVPIAERIAEIRKRKSEERARAKVNAERRAGHGGGGRAPRRPAATARPGGGHAAIRPDRERARAAQGIGNRGPSRPAGQPGGGRPSGGRSQPARRRSGGRAGRQLRPAPAGRQPVRPASRRQPLACVALSRATARRPSAPRAGRSESGRPCDVMRIQSAASAVRRGPRRA